MEEDAGPAAPQPKERAPRGSRIGGGKPVILFTLLLLLAGCAQNPKTVTAPGADSGTSELSSQRDDARALQDQLVALDSAVDVEDARRLALCAYVSSRQLAREYGAVWPAGLHNMLVNAGFKKRGLCHHWADDLQARFRELNLRTLELHLAIARGGTRREHNSVVVCAAGQPFDQGIVLDAWRRSGRLYWIAVRKDRYPWEPVVARRAD